MSNSTSWQDAQSEGNGCLGVVVDSRAPEWALVDETIFAALRHLGLPYQVLDLSRDRLQPRIPLQERHRIEGRRDLQQLGHIRPQGGSTSGHYLFDG